MSAWKPIETAPKDRTEILVYAGDRVSEINGATFRTIGSHKIQIARWSGWGGGVWEPYSGHSGGLHPNDEPTHWMPLPEAPQ